MPPLFGAKNFKMYLYILLVVEFGICLRSFMNKVYKVIWNASIGAWVATSEIAKVKQRLNQNFKCISGSFIGCNLFCSKCFCWDKYRRGIGQGTSISGTTSCREGSANTANQKILLLAAGHKLKTELALTSQIVIIHIIILPVLMLAQ